MTNSRTVRAAACLFAVALMTSCAGTPKAAPAAPDDHLLLVQISDHEARRNNDAAFFEKAVHHSSERVRMAAVRALGRNQSIEATPLLCRLPLEGEQTAALLTEIAFALGQIADSRGSATLLHLARHKNAEVRAAALEAIGKLKGEFPAWTAEAQVAAVADTSPRVRGEAVLALWRRESTESVPMLIQLYKNETDAGVRWRTIYALMRLKNPLKFPALRAALTSDSEWVPTFAAWGLRNPCDPGAIDALKWLLLDPAKHWTAHVQGLLTLKEMRKQKIGDAEAIAGVLADPEVRKQALASPLVGAAWIEALAEGGGAAEAQVLREITQNPPSSSMLRAALANVGKVNGKELEAQPLLAQFQNHQDPWVRAAAAIGLGDCGPGAVSTLARCLDAGAEKDARVRAAAAASLCKIKEQDAWRAVMDTGLADQDTAVRGTAVEGLLEGKPAGWEEAVVRAYLDSSGHQHCELRQSILKGLKDHPEPLAKILVSALEDPLPAVRQVAREVSGKDTVPAASNPALEPPPYPDPDPGVQAAPVKNPRLKMETERGTIVLELYAADAPRHVANITYLAGKGFYDGLCFHRVVGAFVVQGGDQRGDGYGDAGYFVPDEINRIPYVRGTLGMPKSSKDDGGCQIFITHLPTPHLDGRYTVFGQVIEGLEVIDRIEVGDKIISVRVE